MRRIIVALLASAFALAGVTGALATHKPGHYPKGQAKAKSGGKVTICHRTGSTSKPTRTLRVSMRAWDRAHKKHGDTMGACGPNGVARGFTRLTTDLTAVGGATGSGSAVVDIRLHGQRARICYTLQVTGVNATAAHIHTFAAQTIGGQSFAANAIVVPLETPNANGMAMDCVNVGRAIGAAILANPGNFYINVHSAANPGGQVQGTLTT